MDNDKGPIAFPVPVEEELLSVSDIENTPDVEYATVVSWGGKKARIKSLRAGDLIEFRESNEGPAKKTAGLRLIIRSLVDKSGNCILNDTHLPMLRTKSERECNVIIKEILKLNGMDVTAENRAKND